MKVCLVSVQPGLDARAMFSDELLKESQMPDRWLSS
jgi:hypothetical protein